MGTRESSSREDVELVRVERTIVVEAPPDQVWRSLGRLDELADWLGLTTDPTTDPAPDSSQPGPLEVGAAARLVEPDGTIRHLLVSGVDAPGRLAWHWWREDGELSAVEITVEPVTPVGSGDTGERSRVRVVETLALASVGSGGSARMQLCRRLEADWEVRLTTVAPRLAAKLGVGALR